MAMNMWMTISVCVVVVMATTVVGSTPLQERGLSLDERRAIGCCAWQVYDCLVQRGHYWYICYSWASWICTRGLSDRCCPGLERCIRRCVSGYKNVCYYHCIFESC
nr:conotoxin precursor con-ikot-ikot [Conus ebraeus]DAZ85821.1 TPA_inf: conotoxin precursor Conikotikot [Conus ebraeus]DAZ86138.1 TPA_inf: conotoxin precursor Con-ikot-ikot [Conus ebraeus]